MALVTPPFARRRARAAAPDPVPAVLSLGLDATRLTAGLRSRRAQDRLDHSAHLTAHGPLPDPGEFGLHDLLALTERIALRERGPAGSPFHRKLRAVMASARRSGLTAAVAVDAVEDDPSCRKDEVLLRRAPHLVLDGALLTAEVLGAQQVVIAVSHPAAAAAMKAAVAERQPRRRARGPEVRVVRPQERFVTGVGDASAGGLEGVPTLFSNAETWAQLAVAARMGAARFGALGERDEPGTFLATVTAHTSGDKGSAQTVVETPLGAPLAALLERCGTDAGQAVLLGGYDGAFLPRRAADTALMSRRGIEAAGAVFGAGSVTRVPEETCPLGEVARAAHWLAAERVSHCVPCFRGLSALAAALDDVVHDGGAPVRERLREQVAAVRGRRACAHPDGAAQFVLSALSTFSDDLAAHALGSGCGRRVRGALPLPRGPQAVRTAERFTMDWTLCDGHALCADVVPELIRMEQDGYPVLSATAVPPRLAARARLAVRRCPTLALRVERI
ncbi:ferredoxin [Streptomyces sp. NPDC051985]|uniref:ferredoxin n=1 Tax=Streptomyces sp. NPDC051985 TaxID=3155807 RepID=UPI00342B738F